MAGGWLFTEVRVGRERQPHPFWITGLRSIACAKPAKKSVRDRGPEHPGRARSLPTSAGGSGFGVLGLPCLGVNDLGVNDLAVNDLAVHHLAVHHLGLGSVLR